MANIRRPRRGSMGYSPRKRAKRIFPRVGRKAESKEAKPTEFAGYKVGMLQLMMVNDRKGSPTANQEIMVPATLIEAPPLAVLGIRAYKKQLTETWFLRKCGRKAMTGSLAAP